MGGAPRCFVLSRARSQDLDVVLRGADADIGRVVRFDASERAMKQLELRKSDEAVPMSPASSIPMRSKVLAAMKDMFTCAYVYKPTQRRGHSRTPHLLCLCQPPTTLILTLTLLTVTLTRTCYPQTNLGKDGLGGGMTPSASPAAGAGDLSRSAIYVNALPNNATEADIVEAFKECGGIKMVNARHVASGGFAFVFFDTDTGAENALGRSQVKVKGKVVNVLAKKQIPGA